MTREEMINLAVETLEKRGINEIELEGSVSDSNVTFRVYAVKNTPPPIVDTNLN